MAEIRASFPVTVNCLSMQLIYKNVSLVGQQFGAYVLIESHTELVHVPMTEYFGLF